MPGRRLAVVALAALALLAPLAAAATADGDVQLRSLALPGAGSLSAARGDALWEGAAPPTLQLTAASIVVERHGARWTAFPNGRLGEETVNERIDLGAGALSLAPGTGAQLVVLRSGGPLDQAALEDASVRPVEGALLARAVDDGTGRCDRPACIDAFGVYEVASSSSSAAIAGDVTLLLHGPTARVVTTSGTREVATGSRDAAGAVPAREEVWALVHLRGAEGTFVAPGPVAWYVPAPTLEAASADLAEVDGAFRVGVAAYRASGQDVRIAGTLRLEASPVAAASAWPERADEHAAYAASFEMSLSGEVTSITLSAVPIHLQPVAQAAGLLALLATGLVAYAWQQVAFHATAAALPLYTRLKSPQILANEVRNGIYEIVRANPGISAREVHRRSQQSWGTVVYHLRQLERHHLVVSRTVGRTRNYYENHGKYRGMEVQLACLQSARARALARIVLASPGISQEDLVERSGLPQPTTSYYVRKLKAASLVEERREGRYARYHPLPETGRFLSMADAAHAPKLGFADGVQA